jgi:hypothetical protein
MIKSFTRNFNRGKRAVQNGWPLFFNIPQMGAIQEYERILS